MLPSAGKRSIKEHTFGRRWRGARRYPSTDSEDKFEGNHWPYLCSQGEHFKTHAVILSLGWIHGSKGGEFTVLKTRLRMIIDMYHDFRHSKFSVNVLVEILYESKIRI